MGLSGSKHVCACRVFLRSPELSPRVSMAPGAVCPAGLYTWPPGGLCLPKAGPPPAWRCHCSLCDTHVSRLPALRNRECQATGDKGVGCWKLPLPLPLAPAPTKDVIRPTGVPERVRPGRVCCDKAHRNQEPGCRRSRLFCPEGPRRRVSLPAAQGQQDAQETRAQTGRVSRARRGFLGQQPRTRSPG